MARLGVRGLWQMDVSVRLMTLRAMRALFVAVLPGVGLAAQIPAPSVPAGSQDQPRFESGLPARAQGTGGHCQFSGPLLHVPSETAAPGGILTRVSLPATARYA